MGKPWLKKGQKIDKGFAVDGQLLKKTFDQLRVDTGLSYVDQCKDIGVDQRTIRSAIRWSRITNHTAQKLKAAGLEIVVV